MTVEWRNFELQQAIHNGEISPELFPILDAIITGLEAKISLSEIVAANELKYKDNPGEEDLLLGQLDEATSWVRQHSEMLNLVLDHTMPPGDQGY